MKKKKNKIIIISSTLILIFLCIGFCEPHLVDKIITPFKKNINCVEYEKKNYSLNLQDGLSSYIKSASKNGISKCSDKNEVLNNSELIKIANSDFFKIDNLTHSYPYLTEDGKNLLNSIGEGFKSKIANSDLKHSKFIVTSLTRTTESIKRLREENASAVINSPHQYGECFDITYKRFLNYNVKLKPCHIEYLKETLAGVIYELKKNKVCWAITEYQQHCFHVVSR